MSRDSHGATGRIVLVALGLLVCLAVAGAVASPPPRPICSVCGDALEDAGTDRDLDLSVADSEVVIAVDSDGSARWTVTNELADVETAQRLRERPEELQSLVATAIEDYHWDRPAAESVSGIETAIDDDGVVTIEFRQSGFADRRSGGVLLSEYFYTSDEGFWYQWTVDRLEVRPPEDYRFTNRPGDANSPESIVWTDGAPESVYVAMADGDGIGASLASHVAIADETVPYVLANLRLVLPGVLLFGGLAWGLGRLRSSGPLGRERLGGLLVAGGALLVVHPLFAMVPGLLGSPSWPLAAVGLTYLGAGVLALTESDSVELWHLLVIPVGAVLVVGLGLVLSRLASGGSLADAAGGTLLPAAAALPAGLLLLYGANRDTDLARRTLLGVVGTFLWLALWWLSPFVPPGGLSGLAALLLGFGAVASVLGGAPLYLLGLELSPPVVGEDG